MQRCDGKKLLGLVALSVIASVAVGCGSTEDEPAGEEQETVAKKVPPARERLSPLGEQAPTAKSLEEEFHRWRTKLGGENREANLAALDAMLPTDNDVATLFRRNKEFARRIYSVKSRRYRLDRRVGLPCKLDEDFKAFEAGDIDVVPLDKESPERLLDGLFKVVSDEFPVYRVLPANQATDDSWGLFVFVNGRWTFWHKLDYTTSLLMHVPDGKDLSDVAAQAAKTNGQIERYARSMAMLEKQLDEQEQAHTLENAAKETVGDLHFGLLVYNDAFDSRLAFGPAASFVRAVCRDQAQRNPGTFRSRSKRDTESAYVARVRRFGANLKAVMSDENCKKYEAMIKEGYLFGVEAKGEQVKWISLHGLGGQIGARLAPSRVRSHSLQILSAPRGSTDDLKINAKAMVEVLAIEDRTIREEVLVPLSTADLSASGRRAAAEQLVEIRLGNPKAWPRLLMPVFLHITGESEFDLVERMFVKAAKADREYGQLFLHMCRLDRDRALKFAYEQVPAMTGSRGATPTSIFSYDACRRALSSMNAMETIVARGLRRPSPFSKDDYAVKTRHDPEETKEIDELFRVLAIAGLKTGDVQHARRATAIIEKHFRDLRAEAAEHLKKYDDPNLQRKLNEFKASRQAGG